MTKIHFYVIKQNQLQARLRLACRLVQKAYKHNMRVYIHCDNHQAVQHFDDLLWQFNDVSFLPHATINQDYSDTPILIGHQFQPTEHLDYLVNLTQETPSFFSQFQRMAEILDQSPDILHLGRQRYRQYRDQHYPIEYHTSK